MASPKSILTIAIGKMEGPKEEAGESAINEMVEKVFTTRNLVHFAHWNTKSFASHMALGELYDAIVEEVDDIVEKYQGEFGLLEGLECCDCESPKDIVVQIQSDSDWIKTNRIKIANGSNTILNLLDGLTGTYNKILYKLNNLK